VNDPTRSPASPHSDGPRPGLAREATPAECAVIWSLLAANSISERERIVASGLSPRTYEVARRRVFEAGWVHERFVPDPLAWGYSTLDLLVAQPNPGAGGALVSRLMAAPGVFLIWQGTGVVFAASFATRGLGTVRGFTAISSTASGANFQLSLDLDGPSVPIYFDFEGAWSRVLEAAAPRVYPRPLPRWSGGGTSGDELPRPRLRGDAEALIRRPFRQPESLTTGKHLGSLAGLGAGRRALLAGLVERRCFPDLGKLPGYRGWSLRNVAFHLGELRAGEGPERLYRELLLEGGMTPFLFVTDRRSVLIGALSPPPRSKGGTNRRRISEILDGLLESSTLVSAPIDSLSAPMNHQYDRLLPR
jgi:hypothetical protein